MPRHWRCANGHAWTGDLGALTYCPDCGSPDVFEVRPQWPAAEPPPAPDDGTIVQPARAADTVAPPAQPDPSGTLIQPAALPADSDATLVQPPLAAADDGSVSLGDTPPGAAEADGSTTLVQVFVPDDGDTIVQPPPDDGGTLVQPFAAVPEGSTVDQPAAPFAETLDQPAAAGPAADGPTVLAPPAAPALAETHVHPPFPGGGPADGGSVPRAAASATDTPTLDAPPRLDGPSAALPRTVPTPAGGRPPGLSNQDTRPAPVGPPPSPRSKAAAPPVDGYEILSVLGRGGMGVVYKARQVRLNRLVALKMILAGGHAGDYERQRFRTEAEAVAALTHPNIVQVYESGERDGLPYFALEYCDGGSLQQKLGGQPMPPRLAADVAEQLARAMAYAHAHGIVHRDLKPANILFAGDESASSKDTKPLSKDGKSSRDAGQSVTASKASPVSSASSVRGQRVMPKVTDFGLAKRLEEDSGLTGSGTILGTPSYMAPEQAEGRAKFVGPPADIHALGAILYEMLTGRPPFLGSDVVDTMNQVRTLDPVPPTRIQPKTPKDLETITLKCLQKESHRRYASAGDLADDLFRFLHGEPIAARPVPVWEKGWKWAKRRPAAAGLIGVIAAALVAAAVGGLAFARYQSRRFAVEASLRQDADRQKELAVAAYQRAEDNFKAARDAADSLLVRIGAERLEHVPQAEKLRRELLEKSLAFYDRFLTAHGDDPAVRREAGWAFQRVGRIRNDLGDRKAAIAAYGKAADLFDSLAHQSAGPEDRFDLAQTHRQLAIVLEDDGKPAAADAAYDSARGVLQQLADASADRPAYRLQLGELLVDRGAQLYRRRRLAESADAFRQSLAEFDRLCHDAPTADHRFSRARAQANLGAVVLVAGQSGPALADLRKAVDQLTDLVRDAPDHPEYVKELGQAAFNLGNALYQTGQPTEAEAAYRDAINRLGKLAADFPKIPEYRYVLAQAQDNLATFLRDTRGRRAAEAERQRGRELFRQLVQEVPDNADFRLRYSRDLDEYAAFLAETDRLADAINEQKAAVGLIRGLAAADPLNPELAGDHARMHLKLGQLYARAGQADDAEAEYAVAAALFEGLADRRLPDDTAWHDLPAVYTNQALLFKQLGRDRAAERCVRQAVAALEGIAAARPDQPDPLARLADALAFLAGLPTVKPAEAVDLTREAVRRQRAALALAPKRTDFVDALGRYGTALVGRLADQGDHAAAAAAATELARDVPATWGGWPATAGQLARCVRLARADQTLAEAERQRRASAYGGQALGLLRAAVAAGYKDAAALRESPALEVLRTDEAFRPAFEKLLADAEGRGKK